MLLLIIRKKRKGNRSMAICEKTGLEFEARSKKQRNHPEIMNLLNEAHRKGWYDQALEAIKKGREQGFTTLEQFLVAMREAGEKATQIHNAQIDEKKQLERDRKEARRQRFVLNAFLRENGYTWKRYENDEEDQDFYGAPAIEWDLWSPEGHVVTVRQAMETLANQNIKFAVKWLDEHKEK